MSNRFEFTLTGIRPLLMHCDNVEWSDTLKAWQKDPENKNISIKGDDRSPAWTWLGYLPSCDVVTVPVSYISGALRDAGKQMVMKGMKTYKQEAVAGVWFEPPIGGEFFPLLTGTGEQIPFAAMRGRLLTSLDFPAHLAAARKAGFNLDMRRAKIGQSKHVRIRPIFTHWSLVGTLEITDMDTLPVAVLARLFEIAGKGGIGDYRPSAKSPGPFGTFEATLRPID